MEQQVIQETNTRISLRRSNKGTYSWTINLTDRTTSQEVDRILQYIKHTTQLLNQEYRNQNETNNKG